MRDRRVISVLLLAQPDTFSSNIFILFRHQEAKHEYHKETNFTEAGNQKDKCPSCWLTTAQAE